LRWHIDRAVLAVAGLLPLVNPVVPSFAASPPQGGHDLKSWTSEWRESRDPGVPLPRFVRKLALIEVDHGSTDKTGSIESIGSIPGESGVQFLPVTPSDFSRRSFVEIVDPWDGLLAFELNAHKIDRGNVDSVSRAAFELLGIDALVIARSGEASEWSIVTNPDGEIKSRKVKAPPKGSKSDSGGIPASDLAAWIHRGLGYHAVIVDAKGPYMLVTGAPGAIAQGRQGIVRTKSAALISLSDGATGLGGIAEVVESSGNFAVLRMVIGGKSNADPRERIGLKVVFPDKDKASNRR
jgi:hypothetical protein